MALPTVASVVSSGLGQYPTVYYDRVAVETLRANLFTYQACEKKQMPDRSGVAMQIFGYSKLSANTTPPTEGQPDLAGKSLTANVRTLSLSQYADYVSFSDKVVLTNISDTVAEGAKELAYQGALSVETVATTAVDAAATADATTKIDVAHSSYMTASISRKASMQLRSLDIHPKDNGLFYGIISSLLAFDLMNDSSAGGMIDLQKYTDANASKNIDGISNNRIGVSGGVEWFESNALPTVSNFASTGVTGYRGYVYGKNAFFVSSLGKTDLGQKNFSIQVGKFGQNQNSLDPAGLIAAAASYNFFFGIVKRPASTSAFRRVTSESSIG